MKEHPQADILRAIADGHEHFEIKVRDSWETCCDIFSALAGAYEVRIAQPNPHVITGTITVPAPMRETPKHGEIYWVIARDGLLQEFEWSGSPIDRMTLEHSIWRTEAEAEAARDAWQAFLRGGE